MKVPVEEKTIRFPMIVAAVILVMSFVIFFGHDSMGTLMLFVAAAIMVLGFKECEMTKAFPILFLTIFVLAMLVTSGQMGERGFNAPIKNALKYVYMFFAFVCYLYLKDETTDLEKRVLVLAAFAASTLSCLRSLYAIATVDAYVVRYSSQYEEASQVAGFYQAYAIPFFIVLLVYLIFRCWKRNRLLCVGFAAVAVIDLIFVYKSLFTTALILTGVGIVLLLLVMLFGKSKAAFFILLLILLAAAGLVLIVFPEPIMNLAKNLLKDTNFVLRNRILYVLEQILRVPSGVNYSYERRTELASYSLDTFKVHPFFGVGYAGYGYGTIGCHQEWVDVLGIFGFIGSIFVFGIIAWMLITVFRDLKERNEKGLYLVLMILFVILGFLNPVLGSPLLMLLFTVAPNIRTLIPPERKKDEREQTSGLCPDVRL